MGISIVYTDLAIRISSPRNVGEQLYAVEATINKDSLFFGGVLCLDETNLRANIFNNQAYGKLLREALFTEPINRAYYRAREIADAKTDNQLRIKLQIDSDCSTLHAIRWERLSIPTTGHQDVPLSVSSSTPFSRFISMETVITKPQSKRPLRMTVAIASPTNLPTGLAPINVKKELFSLHQSLAGVHTPDKLLITILPGITGIESETRKQLNKAGFVIQDGATTLKTMQEHLLTCDLFHYLGHGAFRPGHPSGTSVLFLEQPDGQTQIAKDDEIVSLLGDFSSIPRLVFLAACESARRSEDSQEPFVGLGPKLVQAGIPAVVGMQDLVPMQLAQSLTSKFYHGLLEHGIIDLALNNARLPLLESDQADWSIPVLFMRIKDGRLFDADPLRTLLKNIIESTEQFFADKEPPLPLDVIRLSGDKSRNFLFRLETDTSPGDDFKHVIKDVFASTKGTHPHFTILLGGSGTAKSSYMRHLSGYLAQLTLTARSPPVVPIFAHLASYLKLKMGFKDNFHSFLLQSLQEFLPDLRDKQFTDWLQDKAGPIFLFIIDGSDELHNKHRTKVLSQFERFANNHPRHFYLLVCDFTNFAGLQLPVRDYLVVKPLSQTRLKNYLERLPDKEGRDLYRMLEEARLFDLAALPWILVRILAQVRRGIIPHSRSGVLKNLEQELLAKIPSNKSLHTRAAKTLNALGWEMQRSRVIVLSIEKALQIMDAIRGSREYMLEDLLSELIEIRILAPVGDNSIRFSYPGLQSWFAAQALQSMPDLTKTLDDITATLGRLSRLRWWDDTLVLLARSTDDVNTLLRLILYGSHITEGDQVFLAARCIQESNSKNIKKELIHQVTNALIWLSSSTNEPRARRRQLAIHTLGQLQASTAIPHLVRLVLEQVRTNWRGEASYEYSSVRLAAVETLRNMVSLTSTYVKRHYPEYNQLLKCWISQNISALKKHLTTAAPAHQAIAAFVLGNIGTRPAARVLLEEFRKPGIDPATRWAITDALLRMEPTLVTHDAILPFINKDAATTTNLPDESWKKRQHWYERVVYLIGNINPAAPSVDDFLSDCLFHYKGLKLKARAIRAISAIGDSRHKDLFEELAQGDFSNIAINKLNNEETGYLRRVAIGALANIGDQKTMTLLQQQNDGSNHVLQTACHNSSEEIAWRLFERNHFLNP